MCHARARSLLSNPPVPTPILRPARGRVICGFVIAFATLNSSALAQNGVPAPVPSTWPAQPAEAPPSSAPVYPYGYPPAPAPYAYPPYAQPPWGGYPGYSYWPQPPTRDVVPTVQSTDRHFTAAFSALGPLLFSTFGVTAEFRAGHRAGIALAFDYGTIGLRQLDSALPDERAKLWQAGAEVRFYPVGGFDHGMQLGFELLYVHGSASAAGTLTPEAGAAAAASSTVDASGDGFKIGTFVGYKLALPVGFTFGASAGIAYLSIKGLARDSAGTTHVADKKTALPLADVNVGWSF